MASFKIMESYCYGSNAILYTVSPKNNISLICMSRIACSVVVGKKNMVLTCFACKVSLCEKLVDCLQVKYGPGPFHYPIVSKLICASKHGIAFGQYHKLHVNLFSKKNYTNLLKQKLECTFLQILLRHLTLHVSHQRLLYKLGWYGMRRNPKKWLSSFLSYKTQDFLCPWCLSSSRYSVVIRHISRYSTLFSIYINDLPQSLLQKLFADDCIIYKAFHTQKNIISCLERWTLKA